VDRILVKSALIYSERSPKQEIRLFYSDTSSVKLSEITIPWNLPSAGSMFQLLSTSLQGELPSHECPPQCTSSPLKHSPDFSLGMGLLTPSITASDGHVLKASTLFHSRSLLRMLRSQLTGAYSGLYYSSQPRRHYKKSPEWFPPSLRLLLGRPHSFEPS
jgi:hypothetical protein